MLKNTSLRELSLLGIPADVAEPLLRYVEALNVLDAKRRQETITDWNRRYPERDAASYLGERYQYYGIDPEATGAGKYVQIITADDDQLTKTRGVHAVVIKETGGVCKPAGWRKGPTKSTAKATKGQPIVRYRLTDELDFQRLISELDAHGSYLYSR